MDEELRYRRSRLQRDCALQWLEILEDKHNLAPFFEQHHCEKIAIYGAAVLGKLLVKDIQGVCEVSCFIDKQAEKERVKWGIPVYTPEEYAQMPEVDMVVVTALAFFDEINETLLRKRPEIPIISLTTVIETVKNEVWYENR